jgi:hypothetical protein
MAYDSGGGTPKNYGSSPTGSGVPSPPLDEDNKDRLQEARDDLKADKPVGEKLSKWLIQLSNDIEGLDHEKRLRHVRSQIKAHQYFDGNFFGYIDSDLNWVQVDRGPDEIWYTDNQLYPYWRTALMELARTQTEVVITPANDDDEEMTAAANFAQKRYDAIQAQTFSALLKQTENCYALLNGITYRYTYPEFSGSDTSARKEKIPIIKKRSELANEQAEPASEEYGEPPDQEQAEETAQSPASDEGPKSAQSVKICAMCMRPKPELPDIGTGNAPDKCLSCGSEMFNEYGGSGEDDTDVVIGYQDLPHCKSCWIVPNPASIIVSMSASRIEETPFLKWKQIVLRSVLQERYKDLKLPSAEVKSLELRYIAGQQRSTPGSNANWRSETLYDDTGMRSRMSQGLDELEELEFHQVWLDYELICMKSFDEDMPLGDGRTLKAGKPLGSMYEHGLWYAHCEDLIVDMFNECKNSKWTSSPYGIRAGSMYGTGSSVALTDQELINDLRRLVMANAWSNGVPREFINDEIISELSADPQIPTKFSLEPGIPSVIGYGYATAPALQLSSEIYGLTDVTKGDMQNKIGALSGTGAGGLADAQKWGDTATAISIKRDLAVGRFSPDLELMADLLDRPQAYQFLEIEQKYNTPQDWERYKGSHDQAGVEKFRQINIREDLIVTIVPGSWMPKSDAQMQSKMMAFAQILPIIIQSQNPELIAYASEVFGMPEFLGGWQTERSSTYRLIARYRMLCDMFIQQYGDVPTNDLSPVPDPSGAADPQTGQPAMMPSPALQAAQMVDKHAAMPVDIFLDNHSAIQDILKDWRASDEGQNASNLLLATVALRYMQHQGGVAKQQQITTATAQAGMAPMQEMQNQQMAVQQQNMNEQKQMQVAGALADYNNQDADRQHAAAMQNEQLASKERIHAATLATQQEMNRADIAAKTAIANNKAKAAA